MARHAPAMAGAPGGEESEVTHVITPKGPVRYSSIPQVAKKNLDLHMESA